MLGSLTREMPAIERQQAKRETASGGVWLFGCGASWAKMIASSGIAHMWYVRKLKKLQGTFERR
jgi:hypothetical protein